ncbi:MAG: hypothetical protein R3B13_18640 [Polyangiaceae bacterium]
MRAIIILGLAMVTGCGGDDSSTNATGGSGAAAGGGGQAAGGGSSGDAGSGATGASGASSGGSSSGGSSSGGTSSGGSSSGGSSSGGAASTGLSAKYPGDVGMAQDPDVIWFEDFEQASVGAVVARYDDAKQSGLALDPDVPPGSSGKQSMKMTANGSGPNAVDLYKRFTTGYDEWFVRYYAKYQGGVQWHHTGVWVGGYNPSTTYPSPNAGLKPNGDDRFSVSIEPITSGANPRLDFYNYWMKMHSWMDNPSGSTAYYGNALAHDGNFKVDDDAWMCVEIHVKINPSASSGAGAELGVWKNDQSVIQYDDQKPLGYWIKDKFCPDGATSTSCTNYPPSPGTTKIPLDLQYRNTAALKLNYFWPQNYITSGGAGNVKYDHMIVAKSRVGCMQ